MKSYSKTSVVLLVALFAGCGTMQTKTAEEPSAEELKQAAQLKSEYEQVLTTMRQGNYPLAIKQFTAFAESHPTLAGPHANLGILYHQQGQLEEAEQALKKAVALNPKHAVAQNRLGMVYREMGRFDDALNAYNQAIAIDENFADVYLNLGILYDLYLFDGKKALQYYTQYQKMTGDNDAQVSMWVKELKLRNERVSRADGAKR